MACVVRCLICGWRKVPALPVMPGGPCSPAGAEPGCWILHLRCRGRQRACRRGQLASRRGHLATALAGE